MAGPCKFLLSHKDFVLASLIWHGTDTPGVTEIFSILARSYMPSSGRLRDSDRIVSPIPKFVELYLKVYSKDHKLWGQKSRRLFEDMGIYYWRLYTPLAV